jgi:transposase
VQSGQHRGPAHIDGDRAALRVTLDVATLTATRHNPVIAPFYARLLAAHKPPTVALIACVRKLLTILTTWDPERAMP